MILFIISTRRDKKSPSSGGTAVKRSSTMVWKGAPADPPLPADFGAGGKIWNSGEVTFGIIIFPK
jgi:hypothetical protein